MVSQRTPHRSPPPLPFPPQASTVRQKCSLFFQTLLSSSPPHLLPILARLTLQSLHANWPVDAPSLAQLHPAPSPSHNNDAAQQPRGFPLPDAASPAGTDAPAPACIAGSGASRSGIEGSGAPPSGIEGSGAPPSCIGGSVGGSAAPRSWQWREGRLLALELVYEIVLQRHEAQAARVGSGQVRSFPFLFSHTGIRTSAEQCVVPGVGREKGDGFGAMGAAGGRGCGGQRGRERSHDPASCGTMFTLRLPTPLLPPNQTPPPKTPPPWHPHASPRPCCSSSAPLCNSPPSLLLHVAQSGFVSYADDASFALRSPPPPDASNTATPRSFRALSRSTSNLATSLPAADPPLSPNTRPPTPGTPDSPSADAPRGFSRTRTVKISAAPLPAAARQASPTAPPSHQHSHPSAHQFSHPHAHAPPPAARQTSPMVLFSHPPSSHPHSHSHSHSHSHPHTPPHTHLHTHPHAHPHTHPHPHPHLHPPPPQPSPELSLVSSTPLLWVLRMSPPPLPLTPPPGPPGGIAVLAAGAANPWRRDDAAGGLQDTAEERDDTAGSLFALGEVSLPCPPAGDDGVWRMVPPAPTAPTASPRGAPRGQTSSTHPGPLWSPRPVSPHRGAAAARAEAECAAEGQAESEAEAEAVAWVGTLRWVPFELCVRHGMLQVIQCFADRRFELRRMADQVRWAEGTGRLALLLRFFAFLLCYPRPLSLVWLRRVADQPKRSHTQASSPFCSGLPPSYPPLPSSTLLYPPILLYPPALLPSPTEIGSSGVKRGRPPLPLALNLRPSPTPALSAGDLRLDHPHAPLLVIPFLYPCQMPPSGATPHSGRVHS